MGSKNKYSKYIVPILQDYIDKNNIDTYIEPFVGGANIIDKIKCKNKYGYDSCDYLIALLQQAEKDFDKIPKDGNREMWDKGKEYAKNNIMPNDMTLMEIGAIGFFSSYSAGGYPRGYVNNSKERNYYKEKYDNLKKQAPNLKGIVFKAQKYNELKSVKNAVIYCDPPYQNTTSYSYKKDKMDYENFWNWVREISKDNHVFVSEQNAPDDFTCIWEQEVNRQTSKNNKFKATEKLFIIK